MEVWAGGGAPFQQKHTQGSRAAHGAGLLSRVCKMDPAAVARTSTVARPYSSLSSGSGTASGYARGPFRTRENAPLRAIFRRRRSRVSSSESGGTSRLGGEPYEPKGPPRDRRLGDGSGGPSSTAPIREAALAVLAAAGSAAFTAAALAAAARCSACSSSSGPSSSSPDLSSRI